MSKKKKKKKVPASKAKKTAPAVDKQAAPAVDKQAAPEAEAPAETVEAEAPAEGPEAEAPEAEAPEAEAPEAEAPEAEPRGDAEPQATPDKQTKLAGIADEPSPQLLSIIESLLFASEKPLKVAQLKKLLGERSAARVKKAVKALQAARAETGIVVVEVDNGLQLRTHPDTARWVKRLEEVKPIRVSRAALEVMAVAAYRQPVTRAEIDQIRGVDSGAVLRQLLQRDLLRIVGRKDEPGRPFLYGTTTEFLSFFGLNALTDLPSLRDVAELAREEVEPGRPGASDDSAAASDDGEPQESDEVDAEELAPDEEDVEEFDEGDDELLDALTDAAEAARGAERVKRSLRKMANEGQDEVSPKSETAKMLSSLQEVVAVRRKKKGAAPTAEAPEAKAPGGEAPEAETSPPETAAPEAERPEAGEGE